MPEAFDPVQFVENIGRRLVAEFEEASQAGTPGLIGSAREHPARKQLQRLLPGFAGVGSGIVVDSNGVRSRQQDIVIFEQSHCPIFSINEDPAATYYPCEGVIAVGEVKSSLGSKELEDAFEKIRSVKQLRRFAKEEVSLVGRSVPYRKYGSSTGFTGTPEEGFSQFEKSFDQVLGFVLCRQFTASAEAMITKAVELWRATPWPEAPNLIVSLGNGILTPRSEAGLLPSMHGATSVALLGEREKAFRRLLADLLGQSRRGRTVLVEHYNRYIVRGDKEPWKIEALLSL